MRRMLLLLACVGMTCYAQTSPPTGLQVISAVLDIPTGQVRVQLLNQSTKTVVGYVLEQKVFDGNGKLLADNGTGYDFADYPGASPEHAAAGQIKPGQTANVVPYIASGALSAQVTVFGVVYDDRTFEGDGQSVFSGRKRVATEARQKIRELRQSRSATRDEQIRELESIAAWGDRESQPAGGVK
jgi:hypothetical protein